MMMILVTLFAVTSWLVMVFDLRACYGLFSDRFSSSKGEIFPLTALLQLAIPRKIASMIPLMRSKVALSVSVATLSLFGTVRLRAMMAPRRASVANEKAGTNIR